MDNNLEQFAISKLTTKLEIVQVDWSKDFANLSPRAIKILHNSPGMKVVREELLDEEKIVLSSQSPVAPLLK